MKNKYVFITGASTGIGRACALYLDSIGFQVFAGIRRKKDSIYLTKQSNNSIRSILIDITNRSLVLSALKKVKKITGREGLYGLINNAGIAVGGPLESLPISLIQQQFEVNILGHIRVIQTFLPLLRKAHGRIINMGSISGRISAPFAGPYSASKFAMEAITDTLRMELKPWDIQVSIIEPGSVDTPIWQKSIDLAKKNADKCPLSIKKMYNKSFFKSLTVRGKTGKRGISPLIVAKTVGHALSSRKPKTRYVIGRDAKIRLLLAKLLPDKTIDKYILKKLDL